MTEAEETGLRSLGEELSGADQSPWEPRCVCAAFASAPGALVLSMQGWIDLETARSPLLQYRPIDADDSDGQLSAAVNAFGLGPLLTEPEERDALVEALLEAVCRAFATGVAMSLPGKSGGSLSPGGFGRWLPILSCLVGQLGMSRADALLTPVCQAFALIAGHRHNEGWIVRDVSYARRDVMEGGQI